AGRGRPRRLRPRRHRLGAPARAQEAEGPARHHRRPLPRGRAAARLEHRRRQGQAGRIYGRAGQGLPGRGLRRLGAGRAAAGAGGPPARAIYFQGPFYLSPVPMRGEVKRPFITEVNPDHPLTRWVSLADVNIDKAYVLAPAEGDVVIAKSIRDPLIVAGKRDGRKVVVFGFGLDATDLMLRVAFPVLLVNALDWFAGDDAELITTYRTGRVWS